MVTKKGVSLKATGDIRKEGWKMDTLKDLLIRDEEGEGTAFLLAIFICVVAVVTGLLIVYFIYNLIVQVTGINPQFWKMWVAGLSAFFQGPIYNPAMDTQLIAVLQQWVLPVAVAVFIILILRSIANWAISRARRKE